MRVNVSGGTGAGAKMHVRTTVTPWICANGHQNPKFAAVCLTKGCRERRSK